jgi:beta-N-acetylhexosaminidase
MKSEIPHGRRYRVLIVWVLVATWLVGCGSNASRTTASTTIPGPLNVRTKNPQQNALNAFVNHFVSGMSLDDRIGQMMYAQFYCPSLGDCVRKFHPGGMIVYSDVIGTYRDALSLTREAQANSAIPMIIGTDNEGGAEDRLTGFLPRHPSASALTASGDPLYVYQQGVKMAKDNLSVGLNADLAPVVDISGDARDFSADPATVTKYAGAWMQGLHDGGVVTTLKHFPDYGASGPDPSNGCTNPHFCLPVLDHTHDQIESFDFAPYRALINSSDPPDMVMATDMLAPALDALPSVVSPQTITGILRNELHFDGVVISDSLYMGGLGEFFWHDLRPLTPFQQPGGPPPPPNSVIIDHLPQLIIKAIKAGNDFILGPYITGLDTMTPTIAAIKAAIQSGDLTEARINQSCARIIRMKVQHGMIPFNPNSLPGIPQPQYFTPAQFPIKP